MGHHQMQRRHHSSTTPSSHGMYVEPNHQAYHYVNPYHYYHQAEYPIMQQNIPNSGYKNHTTKERYNSSKQLQQQETTNTIDGRKLFVGGLPKDVTEEEFNAYFVQFGVVLDSFIVYDRETGKPRGFGFVTFEDPSVCQYLLRLNEKDIDTGSSVDETSGDDGEIADDTTPINPKKLEIRGRFIELKVAQPRETSPSWNSKPYKYQTQSYYMNDYSSDEGSYNTNYQPAIQQHTYGYETTPMTPIPRGNVTMTPATPAQAVLDMAHHMLFYAQLLATPSLSSTQSPSPVNTKHQEDAYYFYGQLLKQEDNVDVDAEPTMLPVALTSEVTTPPLSVPLPDIIISPSKVPKQAFQIGSATFYPDVLPVSP